MADETGISWADSTFNPWIGCEKVSPACAHCYAETLVTGRMNRPGTCVPGTLAMLTDIAVETTTRTAADAAASSAHLSLTLLSRGRNLCRGGSTSSV